MVLDARGRLVGGVHALRVGRPVELGVLAARPFDLAAGRARGDEPVVARAVDARLELDLHPVLQLDGLGDAQGAHRVGRIAQLARVPAADLGIVRELGQLRHLRVRRQRGRVHGQPRAVGRAEPDEHARRPFELPAVVGELHPLARRKAEHGVGVRAFDLQDLVLRAALPDPAHRDRAVLATPLEGGEDRLLVLDRAAVVDLDPVELVLQPAEAAARGHQTGVVLVAGGRLGLRHHAAGAAGDQLLPARPLAPTAVRCVQRGQQVRHGGALARRRADGRGNLEQHPRERLLFGRIQLDLRERQQAHLPDDLFARRGVRAVERLLADVGVVERADRALPHIQIGQGQAVGQPRDLLLGERAELGRGQQAHQRQGLQLVQIGLDRGRGRAGPVRLRAVGRWPVVLAEDAVHVDATDADVQPLAVGRELEAIQRLFGHAAEAHHVPRRRLGEVLLDGLLLVPVGVHLDAALLHEHAAVMPLRDESVAAEITFHDLTS
ncbi:MAG: hypothetical protein BWY52_02383 [Chloroflexi bacterium ADurb.Bin325]|nr:MAG: hypothetical protein BWY52_02383 [Chloroflexi bacterium ADurb.Bin325]